MGMLLPSSDSILLASRHPSRRSTRFPSDQVRLLRSLPNPRHLPISPALLLLVLILVVLPPVLVLMLEEKLSPTFFLSVVLVLVVVVVLVLVKMVLQILVTILYEVGPETLIRRLLPMSLLREPRADHSRSPTLSLPLRLIQLCLVHSLPLTLTMPKPANLPLTMT